MIQIKVEKKDLYFLTAVLVFFVGVGFVFAWNSNDPAVHGHTADEIQGGVGGREVIVGSVNLTYVWCNLTIVYRDYSSGGFLDNDESCSVSVYYDGNNYLWNSGDHSSYNDALCWRDLDYWLKRTGFDGYIYLGKTPGNSGDSFNCTMIKSTNL